MWPEDQLDDLRLGDGLGALRLRIGPDVPPPEPAEGHLTKLIIEVSDHLESSGMHHEVFLRECPVDSTMRCGQDLSA
jgi:hypothetical protein